MVKFVRKLEEMLDTNQSYGDLQAFGRELYAQCRDDDLSTSVSQFPMGMGQYTPSERQRHSFNKTLLGISDTITQVILEIMVAVSPIPDGKKESIQYGHNLFDEMKQCGCISENDSEFLRDLLEELKLVKAMGILDKYRKEFPAIAYPPYSPQTTVTASPRSSSSYYTSLPAQSTHRGQRQSIRRYGSLPEEGTSQQRSVLLGRNCYTRSTSAGLPGGNFGSIPSGNPGSMQSGNFSSISSGNPGSMSSLGRNPGSMPSGNLGSMSSGGYSGAIPSTSNSNHPIQHVGSHDTGSSDEYYTPPMAPSVATPTTPQLHNLQKSASFPSASLSSGAHGRSKYLHIPHDSTYPGPAVVLSLKTTPPASHDTRAEPGASLANRSCDLLDPQPSAPPLRQFSQQQSIPQSAVSQASVNYRQGGAAISPHEGASLSSNLENGEVIVSHPQQRQDTGLQNLVRISPGHQHEQSAVLFAPNPAPRPLSEATTRFQSNPRGPLPFQPEASVSSGVRSFESGGDNLFLFGIQNDPQRRVQSGVAVFPAQQASSPNQNGNVPHLSQESNGNVPHLSVNERRHIQPYHEQSSPTLALNKNQVLLMAGDTGLNIHSINEAVTTTPPLAGVQGAPSISHAHGASQIDQEVIGQVTYQPAIPLSQSNPTHSLAPISPQSLQKPRSSLSESGHRVVQCSDTLVPRVPSSGPLYPLIPSRENTRSSDDEARVTRSGKRTNTAREETGRTRKRQKTRSTQGVLNRLASIFRKKGKEDEVEEEPDEDTYHSCDEGGN